MHTFPQRRSSNRNVRDARLGSLSDVHDQSVHPAHWLFFPVQQLLIQNVAYEVHISFP
jgi:hypothetical protein